MMIEFDFEFVKREEFDENNKFVEKKLHDPKSQVKCNVCEKIFQRKLQLRQHRKVHRGKQSCTNCGKEISGSTDMSTHRKDCMKDYKFKCTICEFRTSRNYHLQNHLRKIHTVTPTMGYSCTRCDFISAAKVHLNTHMSKDHPKLPCTTCGKKFLKADTLERHIMLTHDEEDIERRKEGRKKTYPCLNCDYVATRKHDLKGHHWNIHIDIEKEVQPRIVPRCNKCGFTSKWGNIQRHEDKCQFGGVFVYV